MDELTQGATVTVRVPASAANLGPGFDSIGLALGIWDECTATVTTEGLAIEVEGQGSASVPCDEEHLVHRSMVRAWSELRVRRPPGLRLRCRNTIPHNRGLGSSAAAIVAGIVAAQALHDVSRGHRDAVDLAFTNDLASELEGHPDNASASVHGGATLSWTDDDAPRHTLTLALQIDPRIVPVVFVPAKELATRTARAALPSLVPHADAAANSARAMLLVEALAGRTDLLMPATRDWLHQESRRSSFAASMELVDRLRAHDHAAVISGAGPSVLVLATTSSAATAASRADQRLWQVCTPGIALSGVQVTR